MQLTLNPPKRLHTRMYQIMLLLPYLGAKKTMIPNVSAKTTLPYARNHGARKKCLKSAIVVTDCSFGAFKANTEDE